MATFYSGAARATKWKLTTAIFLLAAGIACADETTNKNFAGRAEVEFNLAQNQFQSNPQNPTNAWQFARACFDFADFAKTDRERATLADQGIGACRQLIARDPQSAPAHYYLAMNLGQLARTKFLGALKIVREMESEFLTTVNLDSSFDFAGPARNLGLLYREAPSFGSIGSRRKAREWLQRAVQLAPDYPENYLNLIESYLQWRNYDAAQKELDALDALWPKAQKKLTGLKWEESWSDWMSRRKLARKKLEEDFPSEKSPKGSH